MNLKNDAPATQTRSARRPRTLLVGAGAAAALLATPASALAVTGTISKPCYSHVVGGGTEPVVVNLTGGTPGARFLVAATVPHKGLGSAGSNGGTFDAAGNGVATITDVFPSPSTINPTAGRPVDISVQDYGTPNPPDVPIGSTRITNFTMNVSTKPRSPRAHRDISVSGTAFANQTLYGFITKPSSSRVLLRIPLGRGNVCGYVKASRVVAPRNFHTGTYRLWINAGNKLNKAKAIYSSFSISRSPF